MPAPHIVLFDLYTEGHHLQYLLQLAGYWVRHGLAGRLSLVVPEAFLTAHPELPAFVKQHAGAGIALAPIHAPVDVQTPRRFGLIRNNLEHGRLLQACVARLEPDHAVLMYFDHVQFALARGLRLPYPTQLSGIYFRPSFHFKAFETQPPPLKERLKRIQKATLLRAALRHPRFQTLFCLDPYVVPYVKGWGAEAVFLPDGIDTGPPLRTPAAVREAWGVQPGRRIALLFGAIDSRKGVFEVLAAVRSLSPALQQSLTVVLAGRLYAHDKTRILEHVRQVETTTTVQVVVDDRFIPDEEIHDLLRTADLALLTYQRHLGSSGVLLRAAAEAVPVLGSDYGLVGEHIRRHRLGLAVDTTRPEAVAEGLRQWLETPNTLPFDAAEARRFAAENTAEQMAATLFQHLGAQPTNDQ